MKYKSWMHHKALIRPLYVYTALVIAFLSLTARPALPAALNDRQGPICTSVPQYKSFVTAQNQQDGSETENQTTSDNKRRPFRSGEKKERNPDNTPVEAKVKTGKPFVPSEKIPADQAVDFPVDI
jgi:hypothetical protein